MGTEIHLDCLCYYWVFLSEISNDKKKPATSEFLVHFNNSISVFYSLFRNFPGIFGNQQQHYLEVIKRMLVQCMQDQENPTVIQHLFNFVF